jgi:NAD(P)-dependent dehydrogenase (short-subunit alcohol dehydrogenase family)
LAKRPLHLAFHAGRLYFFDGIVPRSTALRCGLDWEANLMSSEQKVAIVTGASQGIGASLVKAYRDIGYGVVANSRSIKASDFPDDPAIATVAGDIASPETAASIFNAAIERFGRIDTLVNNAGVFVPKPFIDYTTADLAMVSGVNLHGFFHISQKVAAWMLKAGSGHIVNITASLADQPIASVTAALTALTKGGLNAVTRSLAIEFAGKGIRVNAVSPGVIRTPMHPQEAYPFLAGLHPVGRMGEIHDIVEAVLFLEKASFVTGEILHVDGGANAGHW